MAGVLSLPRGELKSIGLISVGHGFSHLYMLVLPPLFPLIQEDLAVSWTDLGLLFAVLSIATGVAQLPAGILVDRIGARPVLFAGLILQAAPLALVALFPGYWGLPEKTAEEMRDDGFFVTGDLASVDGEGRVTLVGRGKDLIIAGGFNVYPKEVEDRLDEVAGVAESAVIGAPHTDLGEGVVAVLVAEAEPVEDDTLRSALDAGLARYKHPRRFCWVDELPRNAMGKVRKNVLRERYRDAYNR